MDSCLRRNDETRKATKQPHKKRKVYTQRYRVKDYHSLHLETRRHRVTVNKLRINLQSQNSYSRFVVLRVFVSLW
jgi:hypothetical protein